MLDFTQQITERIGKAVRKEYDVNNSERYEQLSKLPPIWPSPSTEANNTALVKKPQDSTASGFILNSNPLYPNNMIDILNTPFDHLERIVLQDMSDMLFKNENFFKEAWKFEFKPNSISSIEYKQDSNFKKITGQFILDSFTYTPYVDYAQFDRGNSNIGIYSDLFLNDYNNGKYEDNKEIDENRHRISSNLYQLGDLKKDLEDAKAKFRNIVMEKQDKKSYVYTFCEELAKLFSKLSNIRLSHEIYGFKNPHYEYEGIIALDIWYQMLYKGIDAQYGFNEDYFNMNPLEKRKNGDEEIESWNSELWEKYKSISKTIREQRKFYTSPRGVLKKIKEIISEVKNKSYEPINEEFFKQKGKIYSNIDSDYSKYTKYANLHIGRAYDVMTPLQYKELTGKNEKPSYDTRQVLKDTLIEKGYAALKDAFLVVENERLFNVFNSNTKKIENFIPENLKWYSQSQCAIALERIFSRIYSYLQFKRYDGDSYSRHINIDSGYKYLTTKSLIHSDHELNIYFDESLGDKSYLGYLTYLNGLLDDDDDSSPYRLTTDEKKALRGFCNVLSKKAVSWLEEKWDLCPLLVGMSSEDSSSSGILQSRFIQMREEEEDDDIVVMSSDDEFADSSSPEPRTLDLYINYDKIKNVVADWNPEENIEITKTSDYDWEWVDNESLGKELHIRFQEGTSVNLSDFFYPKENSSPTYEGIKFRIDSFNPGEYQEGSFISRFENGQTTARLYAEWTTDEILVKVYDGDSVESSKVNIGKYYAPSAPEVPDEYIENKITYYNGADWEPVIDSSSSDSQKIEERKFAHWDAIIFGEEQQTIDAGQTYYIEKVLNEIPTIELRPVWEANDIIIARFNVNGKPYCDILIDDNILEIPSNPPILKSPEFQFLSWDRMDGDFIEGEETGGKLYPIVIGDDEQPIMAEENTYIVTDDQGYSVLNINANIAAITNVSFTVTYIDSIYGETKQVTVSQGTRIPVWHIKDGIVQDSESNTQYRFRYWKLTEGNMTSSLTVLSNVTFQAVYDEVSISSTSQFIESSSSSGKGRIYDDYFEQSSYSSDSFVCDDACECIIDGKTKHYCTLTAQNPKDTKKGSICPYLKFIKSILNPNRLFGAFRIIDIKDVEHLLSALFKANIKIANEEYFLKLDYPEKTDWLYGYEEDGKTYSFEPTIELKFSNFHCANQIENGSLICYRKDDENREFPKIRTVNRNLMGNGFQYNDFHYFYDYKKIYRDTVTKSNMLSLEEQLEHQLNDEEIYDDYDSSSSSILSRLDDCQELYEIKPLCLYENTEIQSPTDENDFIRHRLDTIDRDAKKQLETYTAIVKKYRTVIMPSVRDIYDQCQGQERKYDCDKDNDYGVFGWCTIPSKTMVDMEYNEGSLYVPSSYDCHNRIGGQNFLQLDADLQGIYRRVDEKENKWTDNAENTYCYLYNARDWTYFMYPFFNKKRNSDIYSTMLDISAEHEMDDKYIPETSNHLNGIVFESDIFQNNRNNKEDGFYDVVKQCEYLAKRHHGENNLLLIAEWGTLSYSTLKKLTTSTDENENVIFNAKYGSVYESDEKLRLPIQDWVDDFDFTSSTYNNGKYKYNIGHAHAIDDFDENSVWFYITMVEPIELIDQVIEVDGIMPFVFWWENRGVKNNGPTVDCYGLRGDSKANYQEGGYCYSIAHEKQGEKIQMVEEEEEKDGQYDSSSSSIILVEKRSPILATEQKWHAVAHTLGVDFSKELGVNVTTDNSGNTYKGAFDPNYTATDEKWKIHHPSNDFGTNQHDDPNADKYWHGELANGEEEKEKQEQENDIDHGKDSVIFESIEDRPFTWNLWNVIRHYAYIKYFKNRGRRVDDGSSRDELEAYTKKIVKAIYRTYKQRTAKADKSPCFDEVSTHDGKQCLVNWTNSFIETQTILERNAREHEASFVLFTGNNNPTNEEIKSTESRILDEYGKYAPSDEKELFKMAKARFNYEKILDSKYSFRVMTLNGIDADEDGMCPRIYDSTASKWVQEESTESGLERRVYQGWKYGEMPVSYTLGDDYTLDQMQSDENIVFSKNVDLDEMYPFCEYILNDSSMARWVRKIQKVALNTQILPVYTSMKDMTKSVHSVTDDELKSITFQVIPSFYWKYEWSYNDLMIHRVGRRNAPNRELQMYDMLGNVWELVRDEWTDDYDKHGQGEHGRKGVDYHEYDESSESFLNFVVENDSSESRMIKGGAFNEFARNTISSSRQEIKRDSYRSKGSKQANVGFRPSLTYSGRPVGTSDQIDLFFLYDATASQNNQITTMVEQSKGIVKYFVEEYGQNGIDAVHVGSALFLGPTIRLMCYEKIGSVKQTAWCMEYNLHASVQKEDEITLTPYSKSRIPGIIDEGRGDWVGGSKSSKKHTGLSTITYQQVVKSKGADGKSSGLLVKFNDFRKNKWMPITEDCSTIDVDDDDDENSGNNTNSASSLSKSIQNVFDSKTRSQSSTIESQTIPSSSDEVPKNNQPKLMALRDGSSGSSGGSSGGSQKAGKGGGGGGSTVTYYPYYKSYAHTKSMNIFCGVPAWIDSAESELIHFGEVGDDYWGEYGEQYFPDEEKEEKKDIFKKKYRLFRYDITKKGIDDFEFPFEQRDDRRGTLSNWWAGGEPVCHHITNLVRDGFCYDPPYNEPLGYLFRKNVPRVIIVFANEFDNHYDRNYSWSTQTVWEDNSHYHMSDTWSYTNLEYLDKYLNQFTTGQQTELSKNILPPDPYCLQILKTIVDDKCKEEGADKNTEINNVLRAYWEKLFGKDNDNPYEEGDWTSIIPTKALYYSVGSQVINSKIKSNDKLGKGIPNIYKIHNLKNQTFKTVLYSEWIKSYNNRDFTMVDDDGNLKIGGVDYYGKLDKEHKKFSVQKIRYSELNTPEFYALVNAMGKVSDTTNVFLVVMDSNAPKQHIDESNENIKIDEDDKLYANFLLDYFAKPQKKDGYDDDKEIEFFDGIYGQKIYNDVTIHDLLLANKTWLIGKDTGSLKQIKLNRYWLKDETKVKYSLKYDANTNINSIFDSFLSTFGLMNPYQNTNIAYARRNGHVTQTKHSLVIGLPSGFDEHGFIYPNFVDDEEISDVDKNIMGWRIHTQCSDAKPGADGILQLVRDKLWDYYDKGYITTTTDDGEPHEIDINTFSSYIFSDVILKAKVQIEQIDDENKHYLYCESQIEEIVDEEPITRTIIWNIKGEAYEWVKKHMCLIVVDDSGQITNYWIEKDRFSWENKYKDEDEEGIEKIITDVPEFNKFRLDEQNLEYFGFGDDIDYKSKKTNKGETIWYYTNYNYTACTIKSIFTSEAAPENGYSVSGTSLLGSVTSTDKKGDGGFIVSAKDYFTLTGTPIDYVTIEYKYKPNNEEETTDGNLTTTGNLKIVTMNPKQNVLYTPDGNLGDISKEPSYGQEYNRLKYCIYGAITTSEWKSYPDVWKLAQVWYAANRSYTKTDPGWTDPGWTDDNIQSTLKQFFDNLKKQMPLLMSYRYQTQIFDKITTSNQKSATNYDDNNIVMKALPVSDAEKITQVIQNTLETSSTLTQTGALSSGACIVDLNPPKSSESGLLQNESSQSKFLMKFTGRKSPNTDDTYKKEKMILTMVRQISGENSDVFDMGSKESYYDQITDVDSRKYASEGVNLEQAKNNFVKVKLTNGGYYLNSDESYLSSFLDDDNDGKGDDDKKKKKKHKEKYFFIDPFALTIAQWCYIKLGTNGDDRNQENARNLLGGKLREMRESYWRYLSVYEKPEWEVFKKDYMTSQNDTNDEIIRKLIRLDDEKKIYNPLDDTRPYYYSTFDDANEVIDILNSDVDPDYVYPAEDSSDSEFIEFGIPTEAQWEYCCRYGSDTAIPPSSNLGKVFETNKDTLDLIAWYKYKKIGTLPEPERYCTWRISKMLFGISKDTEQINNVWEHIKWK